MEVVEVPQAWVEVNIAPTSPDRSEGLLVDLIDSLVHETFRERIDVWFFGWYSKPEPYHLRLRIRWQRLEQSDHDRDELFDHLNTAQGQGQLARWWEGNHGVAGETYQGEESTYRDLWELSCKDWHSSSELALALVMLTPNNRQAQQRLDQWASRVHLHANRLGWNYYQEGFLQLLQARGRLDQLSADNRQLANLLDPARQSIQQLIDQLAAKLPPFQ